MKDKPRLGLTTHVCVTFCPVPFAFEMEHLRDPCGLDGVQSLQGRLKQADGRRGPGPGTFNKSSEPCIPGFHWHLLVHKLLSVGPPRSCRSRHQCLDGVGCWEGRPKGQAKVLGEVCLCSLCQGAFVSVLAGPGGQNDACFAEIDLQTDVRQGGL